MYKKAPLVAIDATRCKSGGAIVHIEQFLRHSRLLDLGETSIIVLCSGSLAVKLKSEHSDWLRLIEVRWVSKLIVFQLFWQRYILPVKLRSWGVDILFNLDSGSVSTFEPAVTLNQDLLAFDKHERNRYPLFSLARFRLEALLRIQKQTLLRSRIRLFLTRFACLQTGFDPGDSRNYIVPHGVRERFWDVERPLKSISQESELRCLYISNFETYKNQPKVVEGVSLARRLSGLDFKLCLVGGGEDRQIQIANAVHKYDSSHDFVEILGWVDEERIVQLLMDAHIFIFASSCEAFGITLIEAMATGIPVMCSNKSSLPEVAGDSVLYFDPFDPSSLAAVLMDLVCDEQKYRNFSNRAKKHTLKYNWDSVTRQTWKALQVIKT